MVKKRVSLVLENGGNGYRSFDTFTLSGELLATLPAALSLLAFLAFAVLELRFGVAVAIHSVIVVDHTFEETVGFLTDLIAIALFAAAFLYATGWPHGRVGADLA